MPDRLAAPVARSATGRPRLRLGALLAAAVLPAAACGATDPVVAPAGSAASGSPAVTGDVTVFAAASLTGAFEQIGRAFETAFPGADVTVNFGASSGLARQIVSGAPADVFASAAPGPMTTVTDAGLAAQPITFVRNRLEIVVPAENPGAVTGLADFARRALTVALCEAAVPCGAASAKVFAAAGITPAPDTLEQDVKAVLSKVRLGEVDAGLVYRTDVLAAGDEVKGIPFAEAGGAVSDYPIVALSSAPHPDAASAFVSYVRSEQGQQVLAAAGFDRP